MPSGQRSHDFANVRFPPKADINGATPVIRRECPLWVENGRKTAPT